MEAESLLPALRGEEWAGREHVFSKLARDMILQETELMTMVRDQSMKLVEFIDSDGGELFDLNTDPHEEWNLWDGPRFEQHRQRLSWAIARWRGKRQLRTATWAAQYRRSPALA
ncbi:hypothetical protein GCM10027271_47190 [Saccharopolyspora gloriosae]|uniref:N-sulphoglucosamine sulphohydrolase C-terminal domain-containing protein n=1 Tax=Saccharopolyspora gloriosae TaxID=455344 RepID=A0A840NL78_9PSEU|nr:sulfatase/phosphatase domain-containing protein [Saccharopolyspora gloriosae]MBB5070039.1 hypothetical protein [Saccharopolyspora gloriosae]